MALGVSIATVILSVLQFVVLVAAGWIMGKLGPMDSVGEQKFASGNYYMFIPLFSLIEIARATDPSSIANLGLILLNYFINTGLVLLIVKLYCYFSKMDIRISNTYTMVSSFGNIAFFPSIIINSLCDNNGMLEGNENCQYGYGYSIFGLFMLNTVAWGIGPYVLMGDKCSLLNTCRQMYLIKQLYDTPQDFLADEDFTLLERNIQAKFSAAIVEAQEADNNSLIVNEKLTTETGFNETINTNNDYSILEEQEIQIYSNSLYLDRDTNKKFQDHFSNFLKAVHPRVLAKMSEKLPGVSQPLKVDCREIVSRIVTPPIVCCILGVVVGLIPPLKDAIFSDWGNLAITKTLSQIAAISLPVSTMMLGSKLASGFTFDKSMNLRFMDLVSLVIIRFLIAPAIGIAYMLLMTNLGISYIDDNDVLAFVLYAHWLVPPSVVFIALFVLYKHYLRELAFLQFWANVITIAAAPLAIIVYFSIFPHS